MKPYLMLLLAIGLAAVKPVHAQKNAIKQTAAHGSTIRAVVDTGFISVNIDWTGFASCHGWIALHQTISDPGSDVKEINWFGGCNFPFYSGLTVGATYIVSFKDETGQTGYSQPVTVRAGFPPAIAYVSLPH